MIGHSRHVTVCTRYKHLSRQNRGKPALGRHQVELQRIGHDAPLGRSRSQTRGLGFDFLNIADHVKGRFWQVIIFTSHNRLERCNRLFQWNLNTI